MAQHSLVLKGINYDVGTNYAPGYLSREDWSHDRMREDICVIKRELHCNAINLFGSDLERLTACAMVALENDLQVWLQPRLIDSQPAEMLKRLAELACIAEQLRQQHTPITLNIGCELSIFMAGLIPGQTFVERVTWLKNRWWLWMWWPRYKKKLNVHLKKALGVARLHFKGQITYASGIWESVDWQPFDIVGLNYYREAYNQSTYANDLRRFHRYRKPIVITEFGCCSFEGADGLGAEGDSIVDYTSHKTRLKGLYKRDEQVQADYLIDLLKIYQAEDIDGAFVFEFTEPSHPYSPDPMDDLDMASYGIVKVYPSESTSTEGRRNWEPKRAFHAIARWYASDGMSSK